jgi:hypothetical protein
VAIPKTPAETLTEAISFVGKSFPKREIFRRLATLLIGNAFESSLPKRDARDESFSYEASKELFSERFERATQRRCTRQGCLRAKALRSCMV